MKSEKPMSFPLKSREGLSGALAGIDRRVGTFAFAPASPVPLAVLRILLAGVLLCQGALLAPDLFEIYGGDGFFQGSLRDYFASDVLPGARSFSRWVAPLGMNERSSLIFLGGSYLLCLSMLLVGFHTRVAAVAAWFTHMLLAGAHFSSYGVDQFAHIFLFYFIWMPVGEALSVDRLLGRLSGEFGGPARLSLRVLQIHLCIVYFATGVEKAMGEQWWNGEAIWRALMLPVYAQFDFGWMSRAPWVAKLLAWGTLLLEIGYPFFIWPKRTRIAGVVAILGLHVGIGVFMGLGVFAAFMASLTFAVFGVSAMIPRPLAKGSRSTGGLVSRMAPSVSVEMARG